MKPAKPSAKPSPHAWLDDHDDRLLTTQEAGRFLGYSNAHMRKVRSAGEGPAYVVLPNGFTIRYRLGDLKTWAGIQPKKEAA